ncbi:bifunctional folylpolyglutamate synthase/dihydrofolate synthase [Paludifilum halophilum]|nr:folylpolyglutamate synthase/dihydrofolate synthase family protein [Paludifilum halophilum]
MTEEIDFTSSEDVFQWMEQGCETGIRPGLERMEEVLERMGRPERRLKYIHIAGTNGKGSTAAMIASVLNEAGYPTGMFTSPYINHWSERISMDGEPIGEEAFNHWAGQVAAVVEKLAEEGMERPTPFEFWTLVAINYFAREALPWFVVWETGLGGRLDSTNVVYPLVSVITSIGHDHMNLLGESLSEIAAEKAGIIKPGVPVLTTCREEAAAQVLKEKAEENNSRFYRIDRDFYGQELPGEKEGAYFRFSGPFRDIEPVTIPLAGSHQVTNGTAALMTLEVLRQYYATVLDDEDILRGMERTEWPGRLERVSKQPQILLDGAHNPEAACALARALSSYTYDSLHLLIGVLEDKDVQGILSPLLPLADRVVATQPEHPRAMPAEKLGEQVRFFQPEAKVEAYGSSREGLEALTRWAGENDLILVTGTLFLVSELRQSLCT